MSEEGKGAVPVNKIDFFSPKSSLPTRLMNVLRSHDIYVQNKAKIPEFFIILSYAFASILI